MTRSSKKKKRVSKAVSGAMLNNATYAVKGAKNKRPSKMDTIKANAKETSASKKRMEEGKKNGKN